jgi:hypothetical protein
MHPTDEMSLHQSVTPFGKNNYVKPPPNKKGENTKTKNNTKQTINTGKKPSTNQNTDIFLNSKMTKTNKNTTLPLQKVQIMRSLTIYFYRSDRLHTIIETISFGKKHV